VLVAFLVFSGFLKGQLHVHSNHSGDSRTPPAEVARWYATHGYDFIVFTDHEQVTVEESPGAMLVIPGVELTQNLKTCQPPPPEGMHCLLHVNALFARPPPGGAIPWPKVDGLTRDALYGRALDATRALSGLAQLNHPNFHRAADAELIARLTGSGLRLFEVANQSWDAANDAAPTTEQIWDDVLSSGHVIYGTATDDAHHYYDAEAAAARGEPVFTGDRGFVMVRADRNAAAIRAALERGDFYSSSGVLLKRLERTATHLEIETATDHEFRFIGAHGQLLATVRGRKARFPLERVRGSYVRALVIDGAGRRAWIQPQFVGRARGHTGKNETVVH
jgi:predicted metal-dependent phosphoesterase TrpH